VIGPVITALDSRIEAAIFYNGGIIPWFMPPQFDAVNFSARTRCPVLMINGRQDGTFPVASSQRPLFNFLGSQPDERVWMLFEGGHGTATHLWIPDAQAWFDLHLGPLHSQGHARELKARANFAVVRGDWTSAADLMVDALKAKADPMPTTEAQSVDWMRAAILLLLAEDDEQYEKHCRKMIEHFADSTDPEVWERVVKSCSLDGRAAKLVDEESQKLSNALAQATLEAKVSDGANVTLALSMLRLGNAEQALGMTADLDHSQLDKPLASLAHAVAALACTELGQMEAARTQLASATELIDKTLTRNKDGTLDSIDLMRTQQIRHDWLIAEWIREEADRRLSL
jgi:hypothetical protein